jgi:hypothetical protein
MTMMNQCALASCWCYSEVQGFKLLWSRLYSSQQYTITVAALIIVASTLFFICYCCGRERLGHCSTQVIKLMTLAFECTTQYPQAADAILSTKRSFVTYVRYALLFLQNPVSKSTSVTCARVQQDIDGECAAVI